MDRATMKKQIAEQKLKAFSIGSMGAKRTLSKKEQEEQKKKEQEAAAAQAFEEFVATFQENPAAKTNKVWVKAGTYDAGRRREDTSEKGKLYKPQSRLQEDKDSSASKAEEYARLLGDKKTESQRLKKNNKIDIKKKSNLEMFKEELKMIQEEREERHKYKGVLKGVYSEEAEPPSAIAIYQEETKGSFDSGDPCTTNLYLGNLNPKITEQQLMEIFGRYGPLASIKIMWPRSDEEKARGRNCGFVAFMNRKDGERALKYLNGKDVQSYEMKLGWGKSVPIPSYPIYIPPKMLELTVPPPPSGLPFNAQPASKDKHRIPKLRPGEPLTREDLDRLDQILNQAYVKVVVPTDRTLLMLIHRMVEFVVREGPMFEAMIMNKEISNPLYRFLFENQSPAHIYYRWKMYSILQGDQPKEWRTNEFRMFDGGSVWRPPPMNLFTQGMPDELVEEEVESKTKGSLSNSQRHRLEDFLRNLTPERVKVAEAMVFCMEHSDAAEEICECIMESLSNESTALHKKIGRLYLVSDILHNCGIKISNASFYRRGFESRLFQIFTEMHITYVNLESRLKAEGLRTRVMQVFRAWEDWAVYPKDYLIKLQNVFLGLSDADANNGNEEDEDLDGAPLSDVDGEDLDGVPLDGAALMKSLQRLPHSSSAPDEDDIDGVPLDGEDLDGVPMDKDLDGVPMDKVKPARAATFIPSKWETVEENEDSAVTSSKWDDVEQSESKDDSNSKGTGLTSSRRGDLSSERIQGDSGEDDSVSLDDRTLLMLIHRMVEFVVREGPMFEAMIMNKEISNPLYRFLFENQSPAHIYYRWKMYSILQGDQPKEWRTNEFRMFDGEDTSEKGINLSLFSGLYWDANNGNEEDEDLDGAPLSDVDGEDLDGVPLDGAALMKSLQRLPHSSSAPDEDDIDGVPYRQIIWSIKLLIQQVQHYRKKLLRKAAREEKKEANKSERSDRKKSPSPVSPDYRERDRDAQLRNKKRGRSRSNSRSPVRKSRRSRSASFSPPSSRKHRSPVHSSRSKDRKHVRTPSPPPPPRHKRKHLSPSPPRHSSSSKYSKSPPSSRSLKHSRHLSPSPPPARKHKHKHKY
ncbi:U2 snRNP-associated SURP motif-containing protein [Diaphorina citri]|uniref:U2 snRNP-associated SURP motif-containing protein n=1 Tax=Diaphorina citri TaxID=121845 RepID=A0A1S4ERR3_DIACI|nr:U2 snRNP-associated SURP motif-containing protein [Diaphorina citri]